MDRQSIGFTKSRPLSYLQHVPPSTRGIFVLMEPRRGNAAGLFGVVDLYIGEGIIVEEIIRVMEGPNILQSFRSPDHVEFAYTTKADLPPDTLRMLIAQCRPKCQNGPERLDLV